MIFRGQHFEPRYDWRCNSRFPALFHKIKIHFIIIEHLGNDVIAAGCNFLLNVFNFNLHIGSLEMFFRVTTYAYAEIGWLGIKQVFFKVFSFIHITDLPDELICIPVL